MPTIELSHELHPDVIDLLKKREAGVITRAATMSCRFCGFHVDQFTREDGSDYLPDLVEAWSGFLQHMHAHKGV